MSAITGGSAKLTANTAGTTFKDAWHSGKTSTGTSATTPVTASVCPAAFPMEFKTTSKVTGGTAKPLVGGMATNKVCANTTTGAVELVPGTKFHI
jgi:hypothetical protein